MVANRRTDTKPELALRSELHRAGLRFRKDFRIAVAGGWARPDVVFTRARLAVFVDGCFWHGCPEHGTWPKANAVYWRDKIERNQARDRRNDLALREGGWTVFRFWEHEPPAAAAAAVAEEVRRSPEGPGRE